ncbi:hypothetical protein [Novosphingobium sp.]|uniref:phage baseplate plug family protein n=1 Tax=Novosphingobium sp. TaxID=1874826 RepID=UPI00263973D0|nr:hypothetical protein [Novosphingobium sp.]
MAAFEIPLTAEPQAFSIQLLGVPYQMTLQWRNNAQGGWVLDIADATGVPIVLGIALVTGADLLAQYGYLGLGGALFVLNSASSDDAPTFADLGTDAHLVFVTA